MLSYELAKKLKEAGFPHKHTTCCDHCHFGHPDSNDIKGYICSPPLFELIEACGDRFAGLLNILKDGKHWEWEAIDWNGGVGNFSSSPEEAVCNLWLKLHEK